MVNDHSYYLLHFCESSFCYYFAGAGYDSTIPDAPGAESHPPTVELAKKTSKWVEQYIDAMEKVKDALVHVYPYVLPRQLLGLSTVLVFL
jgi:hypothetical protein